MSAANSENGNLIALKNKGKDVKLTVKGGISRSATVQNKGILKAISKAKEECNKSLNAVVSEGAGTSMSGEAVASVQENVADSLENLVWDKYNEISQNDLDKIIEREINGIPHVDDNVDYHDLEDPNQKAQYDAKIAGLKANSQHWKDLEEKIRAKSYCTRGQKNYASPKSQKWR